MKEFHIVLTTTVCHNKHCFDNNDYADDMSGTCDDDTEREDKHTESHMQNRIHVVNCTNYHQMGPQSSVHQPGVLHDRQEASAIEKNSHSICLISKVLLPCADELHEWFPCVSSSYYCDKRSFHKYHTLCFWSSDELYGCVDLDWSIFLCNEDIQPGLNNFLIII